MTAGRVRNGQEERSGDGVLGQGHFRVFIPIHNDILEN